MTAHRHLQTDFVCRSRSSSLNACLIKNNPFEQNCCLIVVSPFQIWGNSLFHALSLVVVEHSFPSVCSVLLHEQKSIVRIDVSGHGFL